MYKKLFISTLLLISMSWGSFAQSNEVAEAAKPKKELAKTTVETSHSDLMRKMQLKLNGENAKVKGLDKIEEAQQFLFEEDKIDTVLNIKSHKLQDVFKELCEKTFTPTNMNYTEGTIGNISYKIQDKGKKQGQVDTTSLIVPVSFEVHTVAKDNVSDARYAVTLNWRVKVKATKKGYKIKEVKLISSIATPIEFLTSEKITMRNAAQKAIAEWYANLPQNLDKEYAEQSTTSIEAMNVASKDIKINLPESSKFTVTDVPTVNVYIDPYQFIEERDYSLYTNPVAYLVLAPVFNVSVDNSYNNADITVSYTVKDIVKPIADKVKEQRRNTADAVINELTQQLSVYVTSHDKEQKANIESLFNNAENDVEVSFLPKYGKEKIQAKTAQRYLSLLKGESINFVVDKIEVVNPNWDSLVYVVNQEYKGKTYSDYTQKRIHLTFDSSKETYLIEKIEVVPNSTRIN